MPWRIVISPQAQEDFELLPESARNGLMRQLRDLESGNRPAHLKKLEGQADRWRLDQGKWRAVLELNKTAGEIDVLRVRDRKDAYR